MINIRHSSFGLVIISLSILLFTSCKKDNLKPPVVITDSVSEISFTTATAGGNVTDEGDSPVISEGVCWGTTPNPTILNNKADFGGVFGSGPFACSLNQLEPNTLYYLKAYATNRSGTSYGSQVSFTTKAFSLASLTTNEVNSITRTTAISGGNIIDNGGDVTVSGICWSTTENPTTSDNKTTDGSSSGIFTCNLTGLAGNTKYYVRAYVTNSAGTEYGNQVSFTTSPLAPVLTTSAVTSLGATTATLAGNITGNGGAGITEYGFVWGTSLDPTTSGDKHSFSGSANGSYTFNLQGLTANTVYHIRAYATNSAGTSYGEDISFTTDPLNVSDVEGNIYNVIRIGGQLWMKENLRTSKYGNGDPVGTTAAPLTDVTDEASPKYQWAYDGNESNVPVNGRLYTWYSVTDARKVCPAGWHVPDENDWNTLTDYLTNYGYGYGGSGRDIAKSMASSTGWQPSEIEGTAGNNTTANNSSGFTAVPSGARTIYYNSGTVVVTFSMLGFSCAWWSATEHDASLAYQRILGVSSPDVARSYYGTKKTAASVRCLKDN